MNKNKRKGTGTWTQNNPAGTGYYMDCEASNVGFELTDFKKITTGSVVKGLVMMFTMFIDLNAMTNDIVIAEQVGFRLLKYNDRQVFLNFHAIRPMGILSLSGLITQSFRR